jgi:hypothetical protein
MPENALASSGPDRILPPDRPSEFALRQPNDEFIGTDESTSSCADVCTNLVVTAPFDPLRRQFDRSNKPTTTHRRFAIRANLGGEATEDYFVDGVTESLDADLSRISGSFRAKYGVYL